MKHIKTESKSCTVLLRLSDFIANKTSYIHFAAWISKRWDDPAFKNAFPYFGTDEYWSTLTTDLHIQLSKIQGNTYHS